MAGPEGADGGTARRDAGATHRSAADASAHDGPGHAATHDGHAPTHDGPAATHAGPQHAPTHDGPAAPTPSTSERGRLLFEYDPPRAHPIVYAGLLVFAFVFVTGSVENLLRENRGVLYAVYAAPFLVTLLFLVATARSTIRIHQHGIAPSRPLALRWHRPFVRWDDVAAVYPCFYDVTGAFVSPFASSDGKVTQMGLALEGPDGRVETVRFTPTRFVAWQRRSAGYDGAIEAVRHVFAERGRPLAPAAESFTDAEKSAMVEEASRPFLPFFAIVLLIASAAPVLWLLVRLGAPVGLALPVALVAPLGVMLRSWLQSRRRNRILNRLAKAAEHERGRAA